MAGIYVHIPFCRSRCAYCDFYSTTREGEAEAYVQALCREMQERRHELTHAFPPEHPHARVHSIYIGGGTPSVLPPTLLHRILHTIHTLYPVTPDAEVTVEMNPDDWPLSPLPFNRVSLGIQTFDDDLLRLIRRRHDAATALRAVRALQAAGIRNISIDLIYGLPGQTLAQWERDLDIAFSLGIQHLSAYALTYEPGTPITRWRDEGRIREATDDLTVLMYQALCRRARAAGFEHYEISNFALPGYRSRHNSSYWTAAPYLGFGPAAHSYDGRHTRRANHPSLTPYLAAYSSPLPSPSPFTLEHLTPDELYDEAVMCGLRTAEGIDLAALASRFGDARLRYLLRMAAPHLRASRLILDSPGNIPARLRIPESSLMISDTIMSDLMAP